MLLRLYAGSGRFLEDLVSCVPYDLIAQLSMRPEALGMGRRGPWAVQFALGFLRVFRLRNILSLFSLLEADTRRSYATDRVAKFVLLICVEVNLFACLYSFVAIENADPQRTWLAQAAREKNGLPASVAGRYLLALYWSFTTMATVGYGDLTGNSAAEYIVCCLYMFANIFLTACALPYRTLRFCHAKL